MVFEEVDQETFLPPTCFEAELLQLLKVIGLGAALDVLAHNDVTK